MKLRKKGRVAPHAYRLAPVRLDADIPANDDGPRWIQIAASGRYLGHSSGPFTFTREVFEEIVENFRAHPSYRADANGIGCADVVAFDFHHASEQGPTEGSIPVQGAPAQAWAQELEIRDGKAAGKTDLWALTRYLPLARQYARTGQYKWTSVTVWPNSTDPVSGKAVGWYLSSIAFTNDPFIQGMEPIAAQRGSRGAELSYDPWCPPTTPSEVVAALRDLFGLGEMASLAEVISQLAQLRTYAGAPGSAPQGVDVAEMVGDLRQLFNLPTLTSAEEVFAETDRLLGALAEESDTVTLSRGASSEESHPMLPYERACIALAARLRLTITKPEDAERILCEAVGQIEDGATGAKAKLAALLSALGQQDPEAGVAKIADLLKSAAMLEEAMPELKQLREAKETAEGEAADADVNEAMMNHRMPDVARVALAHLRKSDPKAFAEKYPKLTPEQKALSSASATTAPTGASLALSGAGKTVSGGDTLNKVDPAELAKIEACEGRNLTEKAMSFMRTLPGNEKLSHDVIHEKASAHLAALRSRRSTTPAFG